MIKRKKILTAAEYEQRKNAAKRAGRKANPVPHRSTIWRRKKKGVSDE